MRPAIVVVTCLMAAGLAAGGPARPALCQTSDTATVRGRDDTRAQRLFAELMSPFCPGLTLATCPSEGADSLRNDIRQRLDRGESPSTIRAAYASAWGENILGAPPLRRWGAVLWLAPAAAALLGAAVLGSWLRSQCRRARGVARGEPASTGDGEYATDARLRERLAAELKAFDEKA
jgi:cytochrome c-type biogenesis protein CcmH/NrfF